MKNNSWQPDNSCMIKGIVADRREIRNGKETEDIYLLVETTLPEGGKTYLPYWAMNEATVKAAERIAVGDWVMLQGTLSGVADEECDEFIWAIVINTVLKITQKNRRKYRNAVVLRGEMTESGCLLDRGMPAAGEFLISVGNPVREEPLEVGCLVPEKAVGMFLGCLGKGRVWVLGALEFDIPKDSGPIDCFVNVTEMRSTGKAGKEE